MSAHRTSIGLVIGLFASLVVLWLFEVSGRFEHHGMARAVTVIALSALAVLAGSEGWKLLRSPKSDKRSRSLALIALLAVAVVVRFAGLDYELMDGPIGDEGVFHKISLQINEGDPFPRTFNYGHVLYYFGAFALWFFELFPVAIARFFEFFFTTVEGYGVQRLLLKSVNAGLAALTAGAVFGAAYRVLSTDSASGEGSSEAGRRTLAGAVLASALIVFSSLYNDISHQLIADVPAAALAAFCLYFVARLLEKETLTVYLLAGTASGLAAAAKYPGGVVAVAIFAVWLSWRIKERIWSWHLLWAALASIGALLAAMPALFMFPEIAFRGEGLDVFFGFRQYAYGGWLGVQPDSNLVWYGRELAGNFGWPALILGVSGAALLEPEQRRRWLWMAAFPVVYLALIFSMSMVVHRNLQNVLPALAILLGGGVVGILAGIQRLRPDTSRRWVLLASTLLLAVPVARTVAWDISRLRPGTRQLARTWIQENVPEGSSIIRERYSPKLDARHYDFQTLRFAAWRDPDEMRAGPWEYLILAKPAYGRFVEGKTFRASYQKELKNRYKTMFEFPKVAEYGPSALRAGPLLTIFELEPESPNYLTEHLFYPVDASFVSNQELRRDGPEAPLQYTRRWQFAIFKEFFAAGKYSIELGMNPPPKEGYLHVVSARNRDVGTFDLREAVEVELPADGKYLFRAFIAPPTKLYGLRVSPATPESP